MCMYNLVSVFSNHCQKEENKGRYQMQPLFTARRISAGCISNHGCTNIDHIVWIPNSGL